MLYSMCSEVFLASVIIFYITAAVARRTTMLASTRYCERLPADDFFALHVTILLGVVYLSFFARFFSREASFRSSRFITTMICAELLSLLFRSSFSAECSLRPFRPDYLVWKKVLRWTGMSLNVMPEMSLSYISLCIPLLRFFAVY